MRNPGGDWVGKALASGITLLACVGLALAQAEPRPNRGGIRNQGGVPLKKPRPDAADPLAKAVNGGGEAAKAAGKAKVAGAASYHYQFKLYSFDGTLLAASYYPSRLGSSAAVVMLIHEANRSRKDFEDPISDLKGRGLAEHLQDLGYAVFSMDLRGHGQNPRRPLTASERPLLAEDLQAAYVFLLDRHNRGDLNVSKLGVVALGEGANIAAAWAYQPGAAVSTEGRATDLSALVLISPFPSGVGYQFRDLIAALAPKVPLALLAGSKDNASKDAVESVQRIVERARLNKVELFPSSLRGYKLLRLEPRITDSITRFLETTIKLRPVDWEPRYNLTPVLVSDISTVQHKTPPPAAAKKDEKADAEAKKEPAQAAAKPAARPDPKAVPKADRPEANP